ncbi:MAG: hypothetical protein IIY75_09330 [Erysipelotrichales bacterium]|nr:hypothetical protein [Erysipelotrichales bacterium]
MMPGGYQLIDFGPLIFDPSDNYDMVLIDGETGDKIKRSHNTGIPIVVSMLLKKTISDSRQVVAVAYTETRGASTDYFYIYLPSFADNGMLTWSAYSMTPAVNNQYYLVRETSI